MNPIFTDITVIVAIAAGLGILARVVRQPTLVAYLVAGILISTFGALSSSSVHTLEVMATFGTTLLLFLIGLEMRFNNFKLIGKASLITGFAQIIFTAFVGFIIVKILGFDTIPALYISVALTFSSTILVVKLLSEKRELQTLYGRIVVGFLIVQDIVAIFMLIFLAGLQTGDHALQLLTFLMTIAKSAILFGITYWLSKTVFPWLFDKLATSHELLFVTSVAWAFGISAFVSSDFIGLSTEIGGFLAGVALAKSLEQYQIASQMRPLRDFFILIFFIVLGTTLVIEQIGSILVPAIILSVFVIIGNPIIVLTVMGILGFKKKTSFYSSVTVAQISEFSLILMAMGFALGQVTSQDVSLVTLVGIVTFITSTYCIQHNELIYKHIRGFLSFFERKNSLENFPNPKKVVNGIILAGAHRLGGHLLRSLDSKRFSIVEFDPVIARALRNEGYRVYFGDITDTEIQDEVDIENAHVVISTIPSYADNAQLLARIAEIKRHSKKVPIMIVTAYSIWEAKRLYREGADYVVLPHLLGGEHLASIITATKFDATLMEKMKNHDQRTLDKI
ncbi:MAG: cation:proton antiporter family protein [Patescibacteria group bacterium]